MSFLLFLSILAIFCSLASSSNSTLVGEVYGFNGETFKWNLNSGTKGKKIDNIFNLLSGFQSFEGGQHKETSQSFALTIPNNSMKVLDEEHTKNDLDNEEEYETISSLLKKYIQLGNRVSTSGSAASDFIEDVVSTVKKVTTIYGNQLKRRANESDPMYIEDEESYQDGIMASASKVINTFLLTNNMEKSYEIGSQATSEDEILEQLASLIVGSDDRGGGYGEGHYGLTKDPITIIALLALAAYLIRAAIEFLRVTNGKRSMSLFDYPGLNHSLPDVLSYVYAMINKAQLKYESNPDEEANDVGSSTWTPFSIEILKLVLLQRKDNKSCFRWQLCNQLNKKSITELQLLDALWIGMGMYAGDQDVLLGIYGRGYKGDSCGRFSQRCYSEGSFDQNCKSCSSSIAIEMKQVKKVFAFMKSHLGFDSLLNGWT